MADSRPTPLSFWRALSLCALLLFSPKRFIADQEKDNAARNNYTDKYEPPHRATVVRAALAKSLGLVILSGAVGLAAGVLMDTLSRCATPQTVAWLQVIGACTLLWGTLFIRGWEVLTYSGVSFTERVNQWLYRGLYCVGTAVTVYSLAFPACKQ